MKKKRFIRLVMACGVERNEAARMAANVGKFGSYEALFEYYRPALAFRQFGSWVRRGVKAFRTLGEAINNTFSPLAEQLAVILHSEPQDVDE